MRISYLPRADIFLRRLRDRDEAAFHSLRGLIHVVSSMPEIDNVSKVLMDFGSGRSTPVYVGEDWWFVYRVEREEEEDVFRVLMIWEASNPPHLRL
ncbi:MAG: hypothetical protein IIC83_06840 [Chloroflexi bacterium]|nr:hypothetical protein [Chloroflexota bacterium]